MHNTSSCLNYSLPTGIHCSLIPHAQEEVFAEQTHMLSCGAQKMSWIAPHKQKCNQLEHSWANMMLCSLCWLFCSIGHVSHCACNLALCTKGVAFVYLFVLKLWLNLHQTGTTVWGQHVQLKIQNSKLRDLTCNQQLFPVHLQHLDRQILERDTNPLSMTPSSQLKPTSPSHVKAHVCCDQEVERCHSSCTKRTSTKEVLKGYTSIINAKEHIKVAPSGDKKNPKWQHKPTSICCCMTPMGDWWKENIFTCTICNKQQGVHDWTCCGAATNVGGCLKSLSNTSCPSKEKTWKLTCDWKLTPLMTVWSLFNVERIHFLWLLKRRSPGLQQNQGTQTSNSRGQTPRNTTASLNRNVDATSDNTAAKDANLKGTTNTNTTNCCKWVEGHLTKNAKKASREKLAEVKEQALAIQLLHNKVELGVLSDKEESFVKQIVESMAMPSPKLLIKDHKNSERTKFPY